MDVKNYFKICCLCYKSCGEFKPLRNFWGEANEVYEVTIKYFDPLLLTENDNTISSKASGVLCLKCWLHINDFHKFNKAVMQVRSSLERFGSNQRFSLDSVLEKEVDHVITAANDNDREQEHIRSNLKGDSRASNNNNEDAHLIVGGQNQTSGGNRETSIKDVRKTTENEDSENLNDDDNKIENAIPEHPIRITEESKIVIDKEVEISNEDVADLIDNSIKSVKPRKRKVRKCGESSNKTHNKNICSSIDRKPTYIFEDIRKKDEFIRKFQSELECDICGDKFPMFDNLAEHFRLTHNNVKCYIRCCSRKLINRFEIIEHINVHINPEIFKCNICGKLSNTNSTHKTHMMTHEKNRPQFECNVCQKTFKQKNTLSIHLLTHVSGTKDFKCNQCNKAFVVEVLLKKHIQTFHRRTKICHTCGKTLRDSAALKKHIMTQHSGIEKSKHPCDVCGLKLASSYSLKQHKAAFHNDGSTVYVCSICDKIVGSERALKFHKKNSHINQRKHKCSYCDKTFKRPQSLREHIATHTGEALYFCNLCPKTFKMLNKRSAHRKKFHPVEWEKEKRQERKKIDMDRVTNKIIA